MSYQFSQQELDEKLRNFRKQPKSPQQIKRIKEIKKQFGKLEKHDDDDDDDWIYNDCHDCCCSRKINLKNGFYNIECGLLNRPVAGYEAKTCKHYGTWGKIK